jgi:uncharacterized protein
MFNAACEGDLALVRYHLARGVDVNFAHPEFLSTALVACTLAGQERVALYLLEAGANPELPSELDGMRPLQAARQAGLKTLETRLIELGATAPGTPAPNRAGSRWARLRGWVRGG